MKLLQIRFIDFLKNEKWALLFVFGLIAFVVFIATREKPVSEGEFVGTIVGVHQEQSDTPRPPELVVDLENGRRVVLFRSRGKWRKVGSKVVVEKIGVRYRFLRFVEE